MSSDAVLQKLVSEIIQPVINLLFVVALLVFLWGVMKFVKNADSEEERTKGKRVIIWGGIGLLIMFGAYGIIAIIKGTFGI